MHASMHPLDLVFISFSLEFVMPVSRNLEKIGEDPGPEYAHEIMEHKRCGEAKERCGSRDSVDQLPVANLMWIKRNGSGIAERLLTAQVLSDIWQAMEPRTEWIVLR